MPLILLQCKDCEYRSQIFVRHTLKDDEVKDLRSESAMRMIWHAQKTSHTILVGDLGEYQYSDLTEGLVRVSENKDNEGFS